MECQLCASVNFSGSRETAPDVKKMQDAIIKNSTEFEKVGLGKLVGSNITIKEERDRLYNEIDKNGSAQCIACNSVITEINTIGQTFEWMSLNETDKTSKEAKRIKDTVTKDKSTYCNCLEVKPN